MRLQTGIALLLAAGLGVGCGKSGGTLTLTIDPPASTSSGSDVGTTKSLFSLWSEQGNLFKIDLRSVQFGVSSNATVTAITSQSCTCKVLTQGTENSGTMAISSCAPVDQVCGNFNLTGTYSKSTQSVLQICADANNCYNLR